VRSCRIVNDTESLTDTCVIELPKKIKWQGQTGSTPPVRRKDRISVWLGYNGQLRLRFSGYVRNVSTGNPVVMECEDGMFLLKPASTSKKAFKNASLDELITRLLEGTGIRHALIDKDYVLGPYRITRDTVAEELAELQREFLLKAYFRTIDNESVLYVGYHWPFENRSTKDFITSKNIIEESLEYRLKEDIKMKVKGTSIQDDNTRIEVEVGDKDGELRSVNYPYLTRDQLRLLALSELDRFKYTGFQGSFTTFGEPAVSKTDIAHVESQDGNKGNYLIRKVEITFGTEGYRQEISLGPVSPD
jgi:hypothetical protein